MTRASPHLKRGLPAAELRVCLVTGGAGFLGRQLVEALLARVERVHVLDLRPLDLEHARLRFFQGDIRCDETVLRSMRGVDTVFHTASIVNLLTFCSSRTRQESVDINFGGTENVIRACRRAGAKRLVYTSSSNVIFDGREIEQVDESIPYPERYLDIYSETKSLAERAVLAANGVDGLLTCAIRPSGIYGPGEKLILPRIVAAADDGRFVATFGDDRARTELSFVDNLVEGHLLAAFNLTPESPVAGQAYFINDGEYQSCFEFFRPLVEGLGFAFPTKKIPIGLMRIATASWEIAHWLIGFPRPSFKYIEVLKSTVSHPCSIEKARSDLGYEPLTSSTEAMAGCVDYCRELLRTREKVDRPHIAWWVSIILGMAALGCVAHHPPSWAWWSEHVIGFIPHWVYQLGLWCAVLTHVHKGMKAVRMAERAGLHRTSAAWGWQTFILGFASMRLLQPRIERASKP